MKFVQAAHFRAGRNKSIRLLVLHDMEAPEKATTAESVAHYFATTDRQASAHYCVDADSEVQCVKDGDTAFAAKGGNSDGLHFEMAGYARQTRSQWLDTYSLATMQRTADLVAKKAKAYDIPLRRLTVAQVRDGVTKGITDHATVTKAFPPGTGHTDPGPQFPWDKFLSLLGPAATTATAASRPSKPATEEEPDMYFVAIDDATQKAWLVNESNDTRELLTQPRLKMLSAVFPTARGSRVDEDALSSYKVVKP